MKMRYKEKSEEILSDPTAFNGNPIENNNGDEQMCIDFINAFKMCVKIKKEENAKLQLL